MSTTTTARPVRIAGIVGIVAGLLMVAVGGTVWGVVTAQLSEQNITVAEDAAFLAGDQVDGPFSAFAQAQIINEHAMHATGGKTYAELDQDDPTRATAMNASFLRASLFTSVIAYGVAALVIGLGVLFAGTGWVFTRIAAPAKVREAATVTAIDGSLATA